MSYCLNPNCQKPQNLSGTKFCQTCGSKLLLKERYRALKVLGQGGFGKTFLGVDQDKPSQPRCAIKQFLPQAQGTNTVQKAAELFEQEAVRLDSLGRHPQIPELLAYFTQDSRQYLVQEFIEGPNLAQILDAEGAFSEEQIRDLLNSLLPALQFIHSHQVIHRDIKPENIIRRPEMQLVLVDFGAAKHATISALAVMGTVIGSAGYTAPEQAKGKGVFASDLYSLGVTCTHLLTQVSPFDLFDDSEGTWVWRNYLQAPVSDELGQILDKMIEGAIKRRYQSAEEVLAALNPQQNQDTDAPAALSVPKLASTPQKKDWRCVSTLTGHSWVVHSVAITPDGKTIVSGSEDATIKIWNLATGQLQLTLTGHSNEVKSVAISPNRQTIVSGSWDCTIKLWHLSTGQEITTLGHGYGISSVAISPDGQTIASGSCLTGNIFAHEVIKLWQMGTGKELCTLTDSSNEIYSLAFSPDGRTLASCSPGNILTICHLATGKKLRTLRGRSVAFSPDRLTLASGSDEGTVEILQLGTGHVLRTLEGHAGAIYSVAFSPDGKTLVTGSGDSTIKLWLPDTGRELYTLTGHSGAVNSVAFSPDGRTVVSGSQDGTIKIWRCD